MKIECFSDSRHDELCAFLKRFAPHHPELGQGDIVKWQRCDRFIALHDNQIVGYMAQIKHDYKYAENGHKESIGWGVTLILDDTNNDIRKQVGRGLLGRAENNGVKYAAVGVVKEIEGPYIRRGHSLRTDWCNMYSIFLKPKQPLLYMGKSPHWSIPIRFLNRIFRPPIMNFRRFERTLYSCVGDASRMIPSDETIDKMLKKRYPLYGERTLDFINYKISQPNKDYHIYAGKSGYVIFRDSFNKLKNIHMVRVCDIVAVDDHEKYGLLCRVLEYAIGEDADCVVAIDSASLQDRRVYNNVGMWTKKPYLMVVSPTITTPMRITMFDSDLDNLW